MQKVVKWRKSRVHVRETHPNFWRRIVKNSIEIIILYSMVNALVIIIQVKYSINLFESPFTHPTFLVNTQNLPEHEKS